MYLLGETAGSQVGRKKRHFKVTFSGTVYPEGKLLRGDAKVVFDMNSEEEI